MSTLNSPRMLSSDRLCGDVQSELVTSVEWPVPPREVTTDGGEVRLVTGETYFLTSIVEHFQDVVIGLCHFFGGVKQIPDAEMVSIFIESEMTAVARDYQSLCTHQETFSHCIGFLPIDTFDNLRAYLRDLVRILTRVKEMVQMVDTLRPGTGTPLTYKTTPAEKYRDEVESTLEQLLSYDTGDTPMTVTKQLEEVRDSIESDLHKWCCQLQVVDNLDTSLLPLFNEDINNQNDTVVSGAPTLVGTQQPPDPQPQNRPAPIEPMVPNGSFGNDPDYYLTISTLQQKEFQSNDVNLTQEEKERNERVRLQQQEIMDAIQQGRPVNPELMAATSPRGPPTTVNPFPTGLTSTTSSSTFALTPSPMPMYPTAQPLLATPDVQNLCPSSSSSTTAQTVSAVQSSASNLSSMQTYEARYEQVQPDAATNDDALPATVVASSVGTIGESCTSSERSNTENTDPVGSHTTSENNDHSADTLCAETVVAPPTPPASSSECASSASPALKGIPQSSDAEECEIQSTSIENATSPDTHEHNTTDDNNCDNTLDNHDSGNTTSTQNGIPQRSDVEESEMQGTSIEKATPDTHEHNTTDENNCDNGHHNLNNNNRNSSNTDASSPHVGEDESSVQEELVNDSFQFNDAHAAFSQSKGKGTAADDSTTEVTMLTKDVKEALIESEISALQKLIEYVDTFLDSLRPEDNGCSKGTIKMSVDDIKESLTTFSNRLQELEVRLSQLTDQQQPQAQADDERKHHFKVRKALTGLVSEVHRTHARVLSMIEGASKTTNGKNNKTRVSLLNKPTAGTTGNSSLAPSSPRKMLSRLSNTFQKSSPPSSPRSPRASFNTDAPSSQTVVGSGGLLPASSTSPSQVASFNAMDAATEVAPASPRSPASPRNPMQSAFSRYPLLQPLWEESDTLLKRAQEALRQAKRAEPMRLPERKRKMVEEKAMENNEQRMDKIFEL